MSLVQKINGKVQYKVMKAADVDRYCAKAEAAKVTIAFFRIENKSFEEKEGRGGRKETQGKSCRFVIEEITVKNLVLLFKLHVSPTGSLTQENGQ